MGHKHDGLAPEQFLHAVLENVFSNMLINSRERVILK